MIRRTLVKLLGGCTDPFDYKIDWDKAVVQHPFTGHKVTITKKPDGAHITAGCWPFVRLEDTCP